MVTLSAPSLLPTCASGSAFRVVKHPGARLRKAGPGALCQDGTFPPTAFASLCLFPYRRKTAFSPGPGDEDSCSWNVLIIFKKGKHNGDTVEVAVMRFLPIE